MPYNTRDDMTNDLLLPPNACGKIIICNMPDGYRLHTHRYFEMELVLSGSCKHVLNGTNYTFQQGDVCFLNPASVHQLLPQDACDTISFFNLSFPPSIIPTCVWEEIDASKIPINYHLSGDDFITFKSILNSLLASSENGFIPQSTYAKTCIEWLILSIFKLTSNNVASNVSSRLQPTVIYIQDNLSNPITMEEITAVSHFSPTHFRELFRKNFGMSCHSYLLNLRLEFSAQLLSIPNLSVSDVCFRSGFRTPEHFSRAFKKKFKLSPENFRIARGFTLK